MLGSGKVLALCGCEPKIQGVTVYYEQHTIRDELIAQQNHNILRTDGIIVLISIRCNVMLDRFSLISMNSPVRMIWPIPYRNEAAAHKPADQGFVS